MSEQPTQRWRFELGRRPQDCKVFLNDELWRNVISFKIEAGVDAAGNPRPSLLTFSVLPHEVQVDIDPSLQGDHDDGLFGTRG